MLMTPEQNEQWQKAIRQVYPAPVSPGQECTLEQWRTHQTAEAAMLSLLPQDRRSYLQSRSERHALKSLSGWHLPTWVLEIRDYYATTNDPADFAFRADVALLGLQVGYPIPESRAEPYQRLLLAFLSGALRPLLEYAEANALHQNYEGFFQIYRLCESADCYQDPQWWLDIQNNYGSSRLGSTDTTRVALLTDALVKLVRRVFFQLNDLVVLRSLQSQLFHLYAEYRECRLPTPGLALLFLTALEAECPPPDWLPSGQARAT